ncbi:MAG: adenylyltransferase/cytidyltransferase family protein, partial [Gammaproteobacteria bacterium]
MDLVRDFHNIQSGHRGCVVTVGNFDGVHLGHQALMRQLKDQAARSGMPTSVITFEPQPVEYFSPQRAAPRLT